MSEPAARRFGRLPWRGSKLPSQREWERSALLEPRAVPRDPELISDGGGLPFEPAALVGPPAPLDADDPAVGALIAQLARKNPPRSRWKRAESEPPPPPSLDGWRLLARTEAEALFGRGRPPELVTVAVRADGRGGAWTCVDVSRARPLRTTREGVRASGWRLDPTREPESDDTELRVLVTEQTWSGGRRADKRVLPPDLYFGADELVLTMFVSPLPGFQTRTANPESPVRVKLPQTLGTRLLIDGALYGS